MVRLLCFRLFNFMIFIGISALFVSVINVNAAEKLVKPKDATGLLMCAQASYKVDSNKTIHFWQHMFVGGVRDLALTDLPNNESISSRSGIKRVTYNNRQNQACPYQVLAITQGVGWGWHLAWADSKRLYIARMDGEAWVSSVPKKIAIDHITKLQFIQNADTLFIQWETAKGVMYKVQSDDDGRNWSSPSIETQH